MKTERIGIATHLYRNYFEGEIKDFSNTYMDLLIYFDSEMCDTVIFTPYTIEHSEITKFHNKIQCLKNVTKIFIETYKICGKGREKNEYVIFNRTKNIFSIIKRKQYFIKNKQTSSQFNTEISPFLSQFRDERIIEDCALLFCGEINIITFNNKTNEVEDRHNFLCNLHDDTRVIINQVHDEMGYKHKILPKHNKLSLNNRLFISIWNKGAYKIDFTENEKKYWSIFHNGKEKIVEKIIPFPDHFHMKDIECCIINFPQQSIKFRKAAAI